MSFRSKFVALSVLAALATLGGQIGDCDSFAREPESSLANFDASVSYHSALEIAEASIADQVVGEIAWKEDSAVESVPLFELHDPKCVANSVTLHRSSAHLPQTDISALGPTNSDRTILGDFRFDAVADQNIVELANEVRTVFAEWEAPHGLVLPVRDLSTRNLRFSLQLQLQRPF